MIIVKARGEITENMLLLKYPKLTLTTALNGENSLMLLHTVLRRFWI